MDYNQELIRILEDYQRQMSAFGGSKRMQEVYSQYKSYQNLQTAYKAVATPDHFDALHTITKDLKRLHDQVAAFNTSHYGQDRGSQKSSETLADENELLRERNQILHEVIQTERAMNEFLTLWLIEELKGGSAG